MLKSLFASLAKHPDSPQYEFVERKFDNEIIQTATRITEGKYSGLIFSTGPVSFTEEDDVIKLNYKFVIEYLPADVVVESDLDNLVGDIIMNVISKEVAAEDFSATE